MAPQGTPCQNWVATWNNYPQDWKDKIAACVSPRTKEKMISYWIAGKEVAPNTGTPHLQMAMRTQKRIRMTSFQKALQKAGVQLSLQVMKGKWDQAREYCQKDGDWEEEGDIPQLQPGKRSDVLALRDAVMEGKTDLELAADDTTCKASAQFMRFTARLREAKRAQDAMKRQEEAMKNTVLRPWQQEAVDVLDRYPKLPPREFKLTKSRIGGFQLTEFDYFHTHSFP